jgi:hypothetical protein
MKTIKIPGLIAIIIFLIFSSANIYSQVKTSPVNKNAIITNSPAIKYGAMAIDRNNGYYYGFSANASTLTEAVKNAIAECNSKGGKCTLVLSYSGAGCIVYRTSSGKNVGMAYGWGISSTSEEADIIAKKECNDRTYGMSVPNYMWSCNDANSGALNVIYNASREIDFIMGIQPDY